MNLNVGIRWDAKSGIPAKDVVALVLDERPFQERIRLYGSRQADPRIVQASDDKIVVYFEMNDPIFKTQILERYFQKTFGFKPERIINTESGIVSWEEYWKEVRDKIAALPRSTHWDG